MSENETKVENDSTVEVKAEKVEAKSEAVSSTVTISKSTIKSYVTAVVVVAVIILGALYLMEKEGRSKTNIFESVLAAQEAKAVVAVVNGDKIINSELTTSIQQFSQAAASQGVDISNPDALSEIRTQALDVLINTRLLKQAALEQGLSVDDDLAIERLATIEEDIGGADILAERMELLGITQEQLHSDIRDELLIQELLDSVFVEADILVTDEDIEEIYENAGGEGAELPPIEEVREQIEAQVKTSKEQTAIDEYLAELKEGAEIEIL